MNNILCYSSFIFLTNFVVGCSKGYYYYAFLFFALFVTSVMVHNSVEDDDYYSINVLDKVVIFLIFFQGLKHMLKKIGTTTTKNTKQLVLIILTFFFCIFVYVYGYFNQSFCFDACAETAQLFHCMMHMIGSMGHHLILFL